MVTLFNFPPNSEVEDKVGQLQNMKEIQLHVLIDRLIGTRENSRKFVTDNLSLHRCFSHMAEYLW
jgi:hypothetical protein